MQGLKVSALLEFHVDGLAMRRRVDVGDEIPLTAVFKAREEKVGRVRSNIGDLLIVLVASRFAEFCAELGIVIPICQQHHAVFVFQHFRKELSSQFIVADEIDILGPAGEFECFTICSKSEQVFDSTLKIIPSDFRQEFRHFQSNFKAGMPKILHEHFFRFHTRFADRYHRSTSR